MCLLELTLRNCIVVPNVNAAAVLHCLAHSLDPASRATGDGNPEGLRWAGNHGRTASSHLKKRRLTKYLDTKLGSTFPVSLRDVAACSSSF
jgi:hypothetical protein